MFELFELLLEWLLFAALPLLLLLLPADAAEPPRPRSTGGEPMDVVEAADAMAGERLLPVGEESELGATRRSRELELEEVWACWGREEDEDGEWAGSEWVLGGRGSDGECQEDELAFLGLNRPGRNERKMKD